MCVYVHVYVCDCLYVCVCECMCMCVYVFEQQFMKKESLDFKSRNKLCII